MARKRLMAKGASVGKEDFAFLFRGSPQELPQSLEEMERQHIERILGGGCHWNISKAAGIPEVNCATFHNKIRKYGLKMGLMMHYCNCNWLKSPKTLGISWMIRSWFRMF